VSLKLTEFTLPTDNSFPSFQISCFTSGLTKQKNTPSQVDGVFSRIQYISQKRRITQAGAWI